LVYRSGLNNIFSQYNTKDKAVVLNPNSDSAVQYNSKKQNEQQPALQNLISQNDDTIQLSQLKTYEPLIKHMKMLQFKLILDDPGNLAKNKHSKKCDQPTVISRMLT
jgi:hypothetical protein